MAVALSCLLLLDCNSSFCCFEMSECASFMDFLAELIITDDLHRCDGHLWVTCFISLWQVSLCLWSCLGNQLDELVVGFAFFKEREGGLDGKWEFIRASLKPLLGWYSRHPSSFQNFLLSNDLTGLQQLLYEPSTENRFFNPYFHVWVDGYDINPI